MRNAVHRPWRALARRPAVHLVIVGTLALGIGSATTVFSLVHALLLAPLPFADSDRLVRVHEVTPQGDPFSSSLATLRDITQLGAFDGVGAMSEITDGLVLTGAGAPARVQAASVSASLLHLLGMPMTSGRTFTPEADARGTVVREAVVSHRLWVQRLGGPQALEGGVIRLNDTPFTVVGVLAPGAGFPDGADVWVPLSSTPAIVDMGDARDDRWLAIVARRKADRSEVQARAELRALGERLAQAYPEGHAGWQLDLMPLQRSLVSPAQRLVLWTLTGAVTCLLLLACANVAGLLLIEAVRRDGEFRLRAVLGASGWRLAGQLLAESALLAGAGMVCGIGLAYWLVGLVRTHAVGLVAHVDRIAVDGTALTASLALATVCCLLIGTSPGVRAATLDLRAGLDGSGAATRAGRAGTRRALVVLEVGLALVLLAGAALMATSFARLAAADTGIDVTGVTAVPLDLSGSRTVDQSAALLAAVEQRLAGATHVEAVGATTTYPWKQFGFSNTVTPVEQAATAPSSGLLQAQWRAVTPGFFEAAGIPLVTGTTFPTTLRPEGPRVVVVTRTLADRLWPDADPVGREILWGGTTGTPRTVIGVVGDIRDVQLDAPIQPMLFVPHAQAPVPAVTLLVKSRAGLDVVRAEVENAWRELVPHLPAPDVAALSDSRSAVGTRSRLVAAALTAMAVIGVVLATSGVYALLAFAVVQRRRELAVRLAVGSTPTQVTTLVMADGLRLTLAGIVAGLAGAMLLGDVAGDVLYGVQATDPVILAAVVALLLTSATAASYLPARAASRTDPVRALRSE